MEKINILDKQVKLKEELARLRKTEAEFFDKLVQQSYAFGDDDKKKLEERIALAAALKIAYDDLYIGHLFMPSNVRNNVMHISSADIKRHEHINAISFRLKHIKSVFISNGFRFNIRDLWKHQVVHEHCAQSYDDFCATFKSLSNTDAFDMLTNARPGQFMLINKPAYNMSNIVVWERSN